MSSLSEKEHGNSIAANQATVQHDTSYHFSNLALSPRAGKNPSSHGPLTLIISIINIGGTTNASSSNPVRIDNPGISISDLPA